MKNKLLQFVVASIGIMVALSVVGGAIYLGAWSVCTPNCHGANDTRYQGR